MRIVITHTDFRLYWPARLAALSQHLRVAGHELIVIEVAGLGSPYAFANKELSRKEDVCWHCLFPDKKMESLAARVVAMALKAELDTLQPDIVLAGAIAFPAGAAAVRWSKARGRPVIIFDNARLEDVPRNRVVNWVKRCFYRNVDAVLIPASSHVQTYRYWGVDQSRIFFGLNVVDNDWFTGQVSAARRNIVELETELGQTPGFILGVGRLVTKKNWQNVLDAYQRVRESGIDMPKLLLLGDGPDRESLHHFIKKNNLQELIEIVPFVQPEILCGYLALASCLILASSYGETWGLVVNEAMASGLPVLVSGQCGCSETLVKQGENGFLFDAESTGEQTHAIEKFIELSKEQRTAMGERSTEIIAEWSLDRFVEGASQAIKHAIMEPLDPPSFLDKLIIGLWRGRYRPT